MFESFVLLHHTIFEFLSGEHAPLSDIWHFIYHVIATGAATILIMISVYAALKFFKKISQN